jgi:hypothetical protein
MAKTKKEDQGLRVRNTPPFKLKDRVGRNYQAINLFKQFGFLPAVIIIEKVFGRNNIVIVRAVLTAEEIKKEDHLRAATITKKPLASK